MPLTRKEFLIGSAALALTGCAEIPPALRPGLRTLTPEDMPAAPPRTDSGDLISHLVGRLTFGARPGDHARAAAMGSAAFVEEQLAPEKIEDAQLQRAIRRIECIEEPTGELFEYKERFLLRELTRATILRAVWSKRQLYEVMVQFWTEHFNIDSSKGDSKWLKVADDRDVIRPHAMGSFPALLRASAKSPAMLWYLDGRVNRKAQGAEKANENYARELLELHTLGIDGGYTQTDVMEVARCLTGWTVRPASGFFKGRVEFQAEQHDDGAKVVLGQRIAAGGGAADFDRVLEIVSLHPATAHHLAAKLCKRFISDEPRPAAVEAVAQSFLAARGEIRPALRTLFARPEFVGARGSKMKRPFEFVVSALRATNAETDGGPALMEYLTRMGQAPFQYPTPEGYALQASPWMGTLLWRWKFAAALSRNEIAGTKIDAAAYLRNCGGEEGLMAHLMGRRPLDAEIAAYRRSGNGIALMLGSAEFQRC